MTAQAVPANEWRWEDMEDQWRNEASGVVIYAEDMPDELLPVTWRFGQRWIVR